MSPMIRNSGLLAVLALVIIVSMLYFGVISVRHTSTLLTIATGTENGTFTEIGKGLADELNQLTGRPFDAETRRTSGSVENMNLLLEGTVELGLISEAVFEDWPLEERARIRILAELYPDYLQFVVCGESLQSAQDLVGKSVYLGEEGSGTLVHGRRILDQLGFSDGDIAAMRAGTGQDSSIVAYEKLGTDELAAALFASGMPTTAVIQAVSKEGCNLQILPTSYETLMMFGPFGRPVSDRGAIERLASKMNGVGADGPYRVADIEAYSYGENQPDPVPTLTTTVYLVSRSDLSDTVAFSVVATLYANLHGLLKKHAVIADINFDAPDDEDLPADLRLHDGVLKFWRKESAKLQIATGALGGLYYNTGLQMKTQLERNGILTRVVPSAGSLDNLRLLRDNGENILALVQSEIAYAAFAAEDVEQIYGYSPAQPVHIEPIPNLRLLARFRLEKFHALVRRDSPCLAEPLLRPTLDALGGKRVGIGPGGSAAKLVAETLLDKAGGDGPISVQPLPVSTMVDRLSSGQLDAGLFVEAVPSELLRRPLADCGMRLLRVEHGATTGLSRMFESTFFDDGPDRYGSQLEGEGPVATIGTRAVLVTTADLRTDVARILSAILGGPPLSLEEETEGDEDRRTALATTVSGLDFHQAATEFYFPAAPFYEEWSPFLYVLSTSLLIITVLAGAYKGALKLRRDGTKNEVGRRIFQISVEAWEPESVKKLVEIRREIRERVKRRYWRDGELNTDRWRALEDLVNLGIAEAREHLERALISEIRQPPPEILRDREERLKYYGALRERLWKHLERGELNAEQHARLVAILAETEVPGFL